MKNDLWQLRKSSKQTSSSQYDCHDQDATYLSKRQMTPNKTTGVPEQSGQGSSLVDGYTRQGERCIHDPVTRVDRVEYAP